jgi:hypothetical protein
MDNLDNLTTLMLTADDDGQFDLAINLFKISKIKKNKFKKALVKKALELRKYVSGKSNKLPLEIRIHNKKIISNLQKFFGAKQSTSYLHGKAFTHVSTYDKLHFYHEGKRFQTFRFERLDKPTSEISYKMKKNLIV